MNYPLRYITFFMCLLFSATLTARDYNYFRLRGEQMYLEGRYLEALDLFDKYEMRAGEYLLLDEEYLHCKAEVNFKLARFDDALAAYIPVLESSPNNINYSFLIGLISRSSTPGEYAELLESIDGREHWGNASKKITDAYSYFTVEPFHALNTPHSDFAAVDFKGRIYFASTMQRSSTEYSINTSLNPYNVYSCDYTDAHGFLKTNGVSYAELSLGEKSRVDSARVRLGYRFEGDFNNSYNNGPITFYGDDLAVVTVNKKVNKRQVNVSNLTLACISLNEDVAVPFGMKGVSCFGDFFVNADVGQITFSKDLSQACMAVRVLDSETASDLWFVAKDSSGVWGVPYRAGDDLNTGYNDLFPFWSDDDYLYFSSDGHEGAGGLDVFRVDMTKSYTLPVNLGPGVNTPFDDFAFTVDSLGGGYLSSRRPGGRGDDDIYTVNLKKGYVKVVLVGDPSWVDNPEFSLTESRFNNELLRLNIKDDSVFLSPELSYGEYDLMHSFPVDTQHTHIQLFQDTTVVYVSFAKLSPDTLPVNFTNFCFDCDGMDEISADKFKRLVEFLALFPEIQLKLTGHTDMFGTYAYNDALAMRRAVTMEKWLLEAGVKNSIAKVSMGKRDLVSVIDHRLNRRVDVELYWPGEKDRITFVSDDDDRLDRSMVVDYDHLDKYKKDLEFGYYLLLRRSRVHMSDFEVKAIHGLPDDTPVMLYSPDGRVFEYYLGVAYESKEEAISAKEVLGLDVKVVNIHSNTHRKVVSD